MELTCVCDNMFCRRLVIENYCSLVDIFWKTEVIGKQYDVRPADENVGGSVVVIYSGYQMHLKAVLRAICRRKRGWFGGCLICFVSGSRYFLFWVM